MDDIGSIITISALVGIIIPFILRSPKIESKDGLVKIQYGIFIKIILIIGFLFFAVITVVSFLEFKKGNEDCPVLVPIISIGFLLLEGFCLSLVTSKKYILYNNEITSIDILGKKENFKIKEIERARLISSDGLRLITKDGKKYLVLQLMSNYDILIKTLNENKIPIVNSKGQNIDMGW